MGIGRVLVSGMVLLSLAGCGSDDTVKQTDPGMTTGSGGAAAPDAGAAPDPGLVVRPTPAMPVFDDTVLHQISITMAPEDWQSILDDSRADDWRHATVVYDGVTVPDVGVRPSGESSRFAGNPKMSLRVRFDAFQGRGKFGGVDVFKLKGFYGESSLLRDRISYFMFRKVMPTPNAAHARVMVNGELRGVFGVIEIWESDAIKAHFSEPVGALYRLRGVTGTDPYLYTDDNAKSYVPAPWEQKLSMPGATDDVVPHFLKALADDPTNIESATDVDNLLSYLAVNTLIENTDGLAGDTGVEDHYQYFDPASGKFFVLPWDPDDTLGADNTKVDQRSIYTRFSKSRLLTIIRDYGTYHTRYKQRIRDVMATLPAGEVQAEIDRIYEQIKDAAHEDPYKGSFDWACGYVRQFIADRYAYVATQL
jgi:spore coat protein H